MMLKRYDVASCRYRVYKPIARWIRKQIFTAQNYSLSAIAQHLYKNATHTTVRKYVACIKRRQKLGLAFCSSYTSVLLLKQYNFLCILNSILNFYHKQIE